MPTTPEDRRRLRSALCGLYSKPRDILRLADDAGVDHTRVAADGSAVNCWHEVLIEARRSGRLVHLLRVALEEYPQDRELIAASAPFIEEEDSEAPRRLSVESRRSLVKLLLDQDLSPVELRRLASELRLHDIVDFSGSSVETIHSLVEAVQCGSTNGAVKLIEAVRAQRESLGDVNTQIWELDLPLPWPERDWSPSPRVGAAVLFVAGAAGTAVGIVMAHLMPAR